jgi:hypothetical protein
MSFCSQGTSQSLLNLHRKDTATRLSAKSWAAVLICRKMDLQPTQYLTSIICRCPGLLSGSLHPFVFQGGEPSQRLSIVITFLERHGSGAQACYTFQDHIREEIPCFCSVLPIQSSSGSHLPWRVIDCPIKLGRGNIEAETY